MKFLRLCDVLRITNKSKSFIYSEIKARRFPKQIKIGRRAVGWVDSHIEKWQNDCITQSLAGGVGWPSGEVAAINEARIAGKSDQEVRALVVKQKQLASQKLEGDCHDNQ